MLNASCAGSLTGVVGHWTHMRTFKRIIAIFLPGFAPRRKRLLSGLMLLCASAMLTTNDLTKPKLKDANDLSVINGELSSYSFYDGSRSTHLYIVRLFEYQTAFQIPADFLSVFSKDRFQSDL